MTILVIYQKLMPRLRKTIEDSIFCFQKYRDGHTVYLYNYNDHINTLNYLKKIPFDIVLFHNTFMCRSWGGHEEWKMLIMRFAGAWGHGAKGVMIQDEYAFSNRHCQFIREVGIDVIFTLADRKCAERLYPQEKIGKRRFVQVLTGYVDEETMRKAEAIRQQESIERDLDIGYRANKVNYSLGKMGYLKMDIVRVFNEFLKGHPEVKADIKNTYGKKNLFLGMDWFRFMLRCRTMLGSLGGGSIHDPDGKLYRKLYHYRDEEKYRNYEAMRQNYEGFDTDLNYTAVSPRCFECAMTRTCQVLMEGDYQGIMKPGVHYIEVKEDFSNLEDVLRRIMDKEYCERIAERTYRDLIASGKYSYEAYTKKVFDAMKPYVRKKRVRPVQMMAAKILIAANNLFMWADSYAGKVCGKFRY